MCMCGVCKVHVCAYSVCVCVCVCVCARYMCWLVLLHNHLFCSSFGHFEAVRYRLRDGISGDRSVVGFSKTRTSVLAVRDHF